MTTKRIFAIWVALCASGFGQIIKNPVTNERVVTAIESDPSAIRSATNVPKLGGLGVPRKYVTCFTRAYHGGDFSSTNAGSQESDGSQTTATYRMKHYAQANCMLPKLVFGNSEQEKIGINDITVKASLEDSAGNIYPVFFGGSRTVVIKPGSFVTSDPVGMTIEKGEFIWSRTNVSCGAGGKWYRGIVHQETGEGVDATDKTDSGTFSSTLGYAYAPFLIQGQVTTDIPSVAIMGDSIAAFANGSTKYDNGWVHRAFGTDYGKDYPHVSVAQSGETYTVFSAGTGRKLRTRLIDGCNHAVVCYAMVHYNPTVATAQADITSFATKLQKMGMKVYWCTIPPNTTSTDSFATEANQTVTALESSRVALNTWLRTVPSPLSGVIEIADATETARNSGKWKVGYTTDGLHPNGNTVHDAMAAAVPASSFTLVE